MTEITAGAVSWYRALTPNQWRTLIAANLGWLFDGYETYALLLTVAPAMHSLLESSQYPQIPASRSRATGLAFTFNAPRFIAFLGPLFAGTLIVEFGGYSHAAIVISCIYILGFCVAPFLPETKGKPLPG